MANAEIDVRLERIIENHNRQLAREIAQLFGHERAADPVEMLSIDEQDTLLKVAHATWLSSIRQVVVETARVAGEEWAVQQWGKIGPQYCLDEPALRAQAAATAATAEV